MRINKSEMFVFYIIHRRPLGESYASYHVDCRGDDYFDAVEDKISMQDIIHLRGILDSIIVAFGKRTTLATTHFSVSSKQAHILQKKVSN